MSNKNENREEVVALCERVGATKDWVAVSALCVSNDYRFVENSNVQQITLERSLFTKLLIHFVKRHIVT